MAKTIWEAIAKTLAARAGFEILPKKNLMPEPFPATLASELERLRTKRQQRPLI